MSTSVSAKASAAGLVLVRGEDSGATQWVFAAPAPPGAPLEGVRAVRTRCGLGLVTLRPFAAGEVLLKDRWLVGVPMLAAASSSACEQCLRVCAWSPTDTGCRGCRARYCSVGCRDAAWREHHQLLCPAVAPASQAAGSVTPLEVFAKHARLAPAILQQKADEVLPRAPTPLPLPLPLPLSSPLPLPLSVPLPLPVPLRLRLCLRLARCCWLRACLPAARCGARPTKATPPKATPPPSAVEMERRPRAARRGGAVAWCRRR